MKSFWLMLCLTLCFSIKAQTVALPKFGAYDWKPGKKKTTPEFITPTITTMPLKIKKEQIKDERVSKRPFRITRKIIHNGSINPSKHQVKFISKKISPSFQQAASPFIFRENTKSNISYTNKMNGFILDYTNHITQDQDGNMWFLNESNIAKFDGINYFLYNKSSGLPGSSFKSMLLDRQNRLWVNTAEGFFYLKNDSLFIPISSGFSIEEMQGFHNTKEDNEGNIWLSSINKGAICYNNKNEILVYDTSCGIPFNYIVDFSFSSNNEVYLACEKQGIVIIKKDRLEQILPQQWSFEKNIISVCVKTTQFI